MSLCLMSTELGVRWTEETNPGLCNAMQFKAKIDEHFPTQYFINAYINFLN